MRKIFFSLTFVFLFLCSAYGREGQMIKEKTMPLTVIKDTLSTRSAAFLELEEDPFFNLLVSFSAEDIKQRIGKPAPELVSDFFLLLPDSLLPLSLTAQERTDVLGGKARKGIRLETSDTSNGFLDLSAPDGGRWEIFVQKMSEDDIGISLLDESPNAPAWEVLVYQSVSVPVLETIRASSYYYKNGYLVEYTGAMINGYQDCFLDLFLVQEQFSADKWQRLEQLFSEGGRKNILFALPRDGKTIKMYLNKALFEGFDIPEAYFKTVETDLSAAASEQSEEVERYSFVNAGLKYRDFVEIFIHEDGSLVGFFNEDEYDNEFKTYSFDGRVENELLYITFRNDEKPKIGDRSQWTDKPWKMLEENGSLKLSIPFRAYNYVSHKWEDTDYSFEPCDLSD